MIRRQTGIFAHLHICCDMDVVKSEYALTPNILANMPMWYSTYYPGQKFVTTVRHLRT